MTSFYNENNIAELFFFNDLLLSWNFPGVMGLYSILVAYSATRPDTSLHASAYVRSSNSILTYLVCSTQHEQKGKQK